MITEAIKKIKEEMQKENNPFVQVIGEFLIKQIEANPGAAVKIVNSDKSIIKSLDEMQKEARKKKVGNYAVLTDQEGFDIVLKYFGIKINSEPVKVENTEKYSEKVIPFKKNKTVDFDVSLEDFI